MLDAPRGQTARHALQFLPMGRQCLCDRFTLGYAAGPSAAPRDKKLGNTFLGLPQCDHITLRKGQVQCGFADIIKRAVGLNVAGPRHCGVAHGFPEGTTPARGGAEAAAHSRSHAGWAAEAASPSMRKWACCAASTMTEGGLATLWSVKRLWIICCRNHAEHRRKRRSACRGSPFLGQGSMCASSPGNSLKAIMQLPFPEGTEVIDKTDEKADKRAGRDVAQVEMKEARW